MAEFFVGDKVRIDLPHGYSKRGVLGISVLYATSPEARFEGAVGTVTEVNPIGPYSTAQYLVDFRETDNSRLGIPWQANWFREEWIDVVERGQIPVPASPGPRVGAEDSASPVDKGASPGGGDQTQEQVGQDQAGLAAAPVPPSEELFLEDVPGLDARVNIGGDRVGRGAGMLGAVPDESGGAAIETSELKST